jgi:hypothetical protein
MDFPPGLSWSPHNASSPQCGVKTWSRCWLRPYSAPYKGAGQRKDRILTPHGSWKECEEHFPLYLHKLVLTVVVISMFHLQGKGIIIARSPGKDLKRERGEAEPAHFLGTPESESPFSFATLLPVIDSDSARLLPLRNTHLCDANVISSNHLTGRRDAQMTCAMKGRLWIAMSPVFQSRTRLNLDDVF